MLFGQDIRLASLLLLNIAVIAAALYATASWTRDPLQRYIDVLLTWYVVQYVAVGVPGMLGRLSPITMAVTALLLSGALTVWASRRERLPPQPGLRRDNVAFLLGGLAFGGVMVQLLLRQRLLPAFDSDALSYHLPVAVQWLQTGRLGLLPLWFFNPANTYSPLAGSTFVYWLMAPMHGDVLARFVQAPAVLLLWAAMLQLGRSLGMPTWAALCCAFAAASRPAFSEIIAPRDDLLLSAFAVAALAALSRTALRDKAGPWRLGAALGLVLATKYTALICLPLFVLAGDAPRRAGWSCRRRALAAAIGLVLAGPWYVRNALLTGNPLYPLRVTLFGHTVLPGLFATQVSLKLRTLSGIRQVLVGGFHGIPAPLLLLLTLYYGVAFVGAARRLAGDPLVRACLLGPPLCLAFFLLRAPYGEVRFLYPAFFVACVAAGLLTAPAQAARSRAWLRTTAVVPLMLVAMWTGYALKTELLVAALVGAAVALVGYGLLQIDHHWPTWRRRVLPVSVGVALAALAMSVYVWFGAYVDVVHLNEVNVWAATWPNEAPAWQFVRENISPSATIAYSQAFRIYPLMGDDYSRRVCYVPVRPDVPDFLHHPGYSIPVSGDEMGAGVPALTDAPADEAIWRHRLAASGAQYLFVRLDGPIHEPPELGWTGADPQHFPKLFRDSNTAIYEVRL